MIEFTRDFFEGEERNGFFIEPMVKSAWAAQMEVLMVMEGICRELDIQMYADWGTLLGAVRHKGFIPWDDDIDMAMLRPDYNTFLKYAPELLPEKYKIVNAHNAPEFTDMLTRVLNGTTISFSEEYLKEFHGCPFIVGVDLYPIDYKSRNTSDDELQMTLVGIILDVAKEADSKGHPEKNDYVDDETLEKHICEVEGLTNTKITRNDKMGQQLRILGDRLCSIYTDEDADELQVVVSRLSDRPQSYFSKAYYDKAIYVPFENIQMPVPVGYDALLRNKFGDDYMTPRNVGGTHDYPFYNRQIKILDESGVQYSLEGLPGRYGC